MLKDKKILLCLTGGIAIYKSLELASMLVKEGAIVKTIMTKSALEFISPMTIQTITKQSVSYKMFDHDAHIEHISLADWADLLVIAPATANIIGKIANGIADDLLSTTIMATKCPILIVPSMNGNMYENPIVRKNIDYLKEIGYYFLEPELGRLACGYDGKGRMPAPSEIYFAIKTFLYHSSDLSGKKILITAGATIEKIDPVRCITNFSSGKMGLALARAAHFRGADVTLIHASVSETLPSYTSNIKALSADEMFKNVMDISKDFDIVIMCAAVSDYKPKMTSIQKIKKGESLTLELEKTVDILLELGKNKPSKQYLVGFAAESENLKENAKEKLEKKNLDMVIANDIKVIGKDESEIMIIKRDGKEISENGDKFYLAHKILDVIHISTFKP